MILYWPLRSVMVDRAFSISAGLETSTVTPGRTAPLESLTVPAMAVSCARAAPAAHKTRRDVRSDRRTTLPMPGLLGGTEGYKESVAILPPAAAGTTKTRKHEDARRRHSQQ